ncbi:MAG TPA: PEP-CTERM sorting domain-containing protein [Bryobacteraceae bacterium]|nr:PEP-CTERM sorting domain-containing protein [Bryobacteraceae bacterium]
MPNSLATVEGNGENITPFDEAVPIRYQQVYAASQFGAGGLITQIAFRPDGTDGHPFALTLPDMEIDLSTTQVAPDAMSATFADNVGPDNTVVYSGPLTLSSADTGPAGGPKDFDIIITLMTPFLYNPASGNLLLDVKNFTGDPSGVMGPFDTENTNGDPISRLIGNQGDVTSPTGVTDTEGLVTSFTVAATATPEPGTLALFGIGGLLVLIGRRLRVRS